MNEVTGYILLNCGKEAIHMNWCNIIVLLFHCTDCFILPSGFDYTILFSIWRIRYFKFKKVQKLCIALLFSLRQIFYFSGHCMTHKPMLINVIVVSSSLVKFSSMFINASLIREITILPHISVIWKLPPNYIIVVVTIITCAVDLSRLQISILYNTNLRFLNIFLLTDDWDRWKWFLSGLLKVC